MKTTYKSFISIFVAVAFFATVALCCCVVKEAMVSVKKSCSHCPSTTGGETGAKECCFSKASPMEIAKTTTAGLIHFLPWIALTILAFIYLKPTPQLACSRYQNGPPGFVRQVPLYIRSRSIRI